MAHLLKRAHSPHGPALQSGSTVEQEWWGRDQLWAIKGLTPRLSLSRAVDACAGSTSHLCCARAPCFSTLPAVARRGENTCLKGTGQPGPKPSRLPLQQLGLRPHPWQGRDSRGAEGKSHLPSGPSPSSSISRPLCPLHYQSGSCQHTLKKDTTYVHIKFSSLSNGTGTHCLCKDAPTWEHPFMTVTDNYSI